MRMNSSIKLIIAAAAMSLTGCASIVSGTSQVVSVETRIGTEPLKGATCALENSKGVFYVTTPGSVTVHRAYGDLTVKCEKDNTPPGVAIVKSNTKGMAFGNILFGGVIGAGVDVTTGAAYDYPTLISVSMGQSTQLPAAQAQPASTAPAVAAPAPVAATPVVVAQPQVAVAPAPVAAPPAATARSTANDQPFGNAFVYGQSSIAVEKMARDKACKSDNGAGRVGPEGPAENYRIVCTDGRVLFAYCEMRQCQLKD